MTSLWSSFMGYFASLPITTSPLTNEAEELVVDVLEIYGKLKRRKNLEPCDEVNTIFERLVDHCTLHRRSEVTLQVLQDPRVLEIGSDLRNLCDVAECHLESHWTDIIISQEPSSPEEVYHRLANFPYFQNYIDLAQLELSAIHGILKSSSPITKIAFLGSGPLPLTSLCLSGLVNSPLHHLNNSPPISVLNIDNNPLAISKAKTLCYKLGEMGAGMKFTCADAGSDEVELKDFDVVYLAALVGSTQQEKEAVLVNVVGKMREGALLVVRSAERLRRLLYPAFDPCTEVVTRCLDVVVVVHPYNHVVNSVVIGRLKGAREKDCL